MHQIPPVSTFCHGLIAVRSGTLKLQQLSHSYHDIPHISNSKMATEIPATQPHIQTVPKELPRICHQPVLSPLQPHTLVPSQQLARLRNCSDLTCDSRRGVIER